MLRAEQKLIVGEAQTALELVERVTVEATGLLRARALRARGRALVKLNRAREGLAALEEAASAFELLGQRHWQIQTLYDKATAHLQLGELGNALALALECESAMRIAGAVDRTLELRLRSFLAAAFARAGDVRSADGQARQALGLAGEVADREALGTLYATLAATRAQERQLEEALRYARKSLAAFKELEREQAIGQAWHEIASIQLARGALAEAEAAIEQGERIASSAEIPSLEASLIGLRAEAAERRKRWKAAEELALTAERHPASSATTRGRALLVRARILAVRRAGLREISECIDRAVKAFEKEPFTLRAEVHDVHAQLLAGRREWKAAYEESRKAVDLLRPRLA
jgi:tetratricopeptide (TPR) repeat protein